MIGRTISLILCMVLLGACGGPDGDDDAGSGVDGSRPGRDAGPRQDGGVLPTDNGDHPGNDGLCRYARATRYPIARESGVPAGTCSFGRVADEMPVLFRMGYVTAPNEVFYHQSPMEGGSCGECYELTGPNGTIVVMAADICDIACCDNCRGDTIAFDIEQEHWRELVAREGGNVGVGWRWVPCPGIEGNIRAFFTSGFQGGTRFRLVVYNHRIGVDAVEVRGAATGPTGGEWTPLVRTLDNYFDWEGEDVGLPITLRVVSAQGQIVEFPELASLASDMRIEAGGNFDDVEMTDMGSCAWPGPQQTIYDDGFGGILGLRWRDWGSYMLLDGDPVYDHGDNCQAGTSCIDVGRIDAWGAIQIGYENDFPPSMFTGVEFWARTDGPTLSSIGFYYSGDDASGGSASSDIVDLSVTGEWQLFQIELAPIVADVARLNVVRWSQRSNDPAAGRLYLDEVRLVE